MNKAITYRIHPFKVSNVVGQLLDVCMCCVHFWLKQGQPRVYFCDPIIVNTVNAFVLIFIHVEIKHVHNLYYLFSSLTFRFK